MSAEQIMSNEQMRDPFLKERAQLEAEWIKLRELQEAYRRPAPQGVAEVMPFAHFQRNGGWRTWEEVIPSAAGQSGVVAAYAESVITAIITERDTLRAKVAELERDAARIDWLEAQINENGALHLHDGNDAYGLGLGLQTGRSIRSLRKAIDDASKEAP